MKKILLMLMAVVMVGCSKKNPPKPKNTDDGSKTGFVMPVKPEFPVMLTINRVETESERKERQRQEALRADAMQRYESEMADLNRRMEKSKRERERVKRNYELAMEKWYNSLVVCLRCGSDLKTKGAKVCAGCGREQRP